MPPHLKNVACARSNLVLASVESTDVGIRWSKISEDGSWRRFESGELTCASRKSAPESLQLMLMLPLSRPASG